MIKFFRRIRQNLLSEGDTGRYLKYALGEIILVVIGILIALQINNWNTHRSDRISETDYLRRLSNDLAQDTSDFAWTIRAAISKREALETLLAQLKPGQPGGIDSTQFLGNLIRGRNLSFALPKVTTGTFEELKNTGNFKQIENTSLRSAITEYYFKREHQYQRIEKKRTEPGFGNGIEMFIPGLDRGDHVVSYRADLVSFREIIDHMRTPAFREIMTSEYNLALFMQDVQEGGLEDSKALLKQLKDELSK